MAFDPDASRKAAHEKYELAQEISNNNPDVSLEDAYQQVNWNLDWQPGDPTYQEVHDNWDYYQQLTNGGQIPVSQAARQKVPATTAMSYYTGQQSQQPATSERADREEQAKSNLPESVKTVSGTNLVTTRPEADSSAAVREGANLSADERAEQESKERDEQRMQQQRDSLSPNVQTSGSQKSLQELQNDFKQWQEDWNRRVNNNSFDEWQRENRPYDEPLFIPDNADTQRRLFNMDDGSIRNPLDFNLLGLTSQQKTPSTVRNLYDYYFGQEDANGVRNEDAISTKMNNADKYGKVVRENLIDDGASPVSREAAYMTGEQYLKYRNQYGIPGRNVEEINPNEIYNKQDEMENYGFIPYIVSDEGLDTFHNDASAAFVSNVFNNLADARRNITDYTIDYNGQNLSGNDFDKNIRLWDQRVANKEGKIVYDPSEADEYAVPQALVAYDKDNDKEYIAPNYPIEITKQEDGSIRWRFNDNPDDDWWFENEQDQKDSLSHKPAKEGEYVSAWLNQEPLVLDSGQVLRADQAKELYENFGDYSKDYGPFDIARPSVENPFEEGGWVPWFTDMVLSSAPYFNPISAGSKAAGDMWNNANAMQPGYQDYLNGTYSLLSDNPTREQQVTSATGSFAMPFTERIWGPLGEAMFKTGPTKKLLQTLRVPDSVTERALPRWLIGASDEGVEEIAGNLVEGYQQNGLDWYANDRYKREDNGELKLDSEGNPIVDRDTQGRARKEPTSGGERILNFIKDAPLAYTGGAALGGVLGSPYIPSYYREYQQRQNERDTFGGNAESVPVDVDALMQTRGLNEAERNYYNR